MFELIAAYSADNPRQWAWDRENEERHEGPEHVPWSVDV
jgi:hypothetical protein